jgi:predicted ribosome quality control (RQC) complex YloA/Tae2 family protein
LVHFVVKWFCPSDASVTIDGRKHLRKRIIQYELPGGWTIVLGASDADNDYVSTVLAAPEDYWFHADGFPGSHVILRAKHNEEPDRETLRRAAAVAAYHSKARRAGAVQVHCARARHVKKPRGAKVGTVHVTRGSVLRVRPDISFAVRVRAVKQPAESDRLDKV